MFVRIDLEPGQIVAQGNGYIVLKVDHVGYALKVRTAPSESAALLTDGYMPDTLAARGLYVGPLGGLCLGNTLH